MSELTVVLLGCLIVGVCGRLFTGVRRKINQFVIDPNAGFPFSPILTPKHTLETARIVEWFFLVSEILGVRTLTEIRSAVVERVVVTVVNLFAHLTTKNESLHVSTFLGSIKTIGRGTPRGVPIPLIEPIEISGVNDDILPLRERDKTVGCVERLNNFVSLNTELFHFPTSNGILKFSRHSIIIAIVLLALCIPAFAQNSTNVTIGPITDSGGILWTQGTWTLTFVGQPNSHWPGGGLANSFTGSLGGTGSATQSTPSNTVITPTPSFWNLTVCPNPSVTVGPSGCVSQQFTITGTSQTISITPAALVIIVPTTPTNINPVVAYADAEISGGWVGFGYYNVTIPGNRQCTALPCSGANWTTASGGAAAALPGNTINVSAAPYNMTGGYQIYDAAITSTSPNVTSTGFTFTSAMVGWLAHYTNCAGSPCTGSVYEFPLNGGAENTIIGCSPSCPSHVAIMSTNASASVAAGSGIFTFGPNVDAGWTALEAALNSYSTTPNCPVVIFGGGYYMTRRGRFNKITCLNPAWNFSFTSGQDQLLTISGLGEPTNSYIEPTQDFDFTTGANNSCGGGTSNNTCFGGAQATKWMNIGVDGGGASLTGGNHAVNVFESTNDSYLFQVYCTNWGASDGSMIGLKGSGGSQPQAFMQFVGCAKKQFVAVTGATVLSDGFLGGTTGTVITVNAGATLVTKFMGAGYINACPANVIQWDISGTMSDYHSGTGSCGAVNNQGIQVENGGIFNGDQTVSTVAGTSASAALLVGNGTVTCKGCTFTSTGSGINLCLGTTGAFYSGGLNTINGTAGSIGALTSCGTFVLTPTDIIGGGAFSTPLACTFTSGGGTSPSCAMGTGSTAERGVIIASTGTGAPGSQGTITLTFGQRTYSVNGQTPVCTFDIDNSGTAWGAEAIVQVNTPSLTAPVLAWTNINAIALAALATSSPYRIDYQCVAR